MVKASARRGDFFAPSDSDSEVSDVSSTSRESAKSIDPYMQKQAQLAQKLEEIASKHETEQARQIHICHKEIGILSNSIRMDLIDTRKRLLPFIDDGFVHASRIRKPKRITTIKALKGDNIEAQLKLSIREYRERLRKHMHCREFNELEQCLHNLSILMESRNNAVLLRELRMDIIHAQICLSQYTRWK